MKRRLLPAAAVLSLAVLSGCTSTAETPTVATAETSAPTTRTTAAKSGEQVAAYVQGMRTWVECMRKRGVDLPDPDPKGDVDFGDARSLKSDPTFLSASQQCKDLKPARPAELQASRPPLTAEQIANARAYAVCMRANGVPSFRDPGPDGYPVTVPTAPGADQDGVVEDPARAAKAGQICEPVVNGRPPASYDPALTGQG